MVVVQDSSSLVLVAAASIRIGYADDHLPLPVRGTR